MRAQQILLAELDARLRRFGLTFSRFEALVLLNFSSAGSLPLSKMGERLQVHATSVTNLIDRLEAADLVRREPNPRDGRGTLAVITERGRQTARDATTELNRSRFALGALPNQDLGLLFDALRRLRVGAGDFLVPDADGSLAGQPATSRSAGLRSNPNRHDETDDEMVSE
jgi:DNA-binding MarR family transcriptional regulator